MKHAQATELITVSAEMGYKAEIELKKVEDHISRMLKNMWLIIISLTLVSFYGYMYSQAVFFTPNDSYCKFAKVSAFLDNFNTIVERFVTYVLWTVPIVYVYWPANRTWYGTTKTPKRRGSSTNEQKQQQYRTLND